MSGIIIGGDASRPERSVKLIEPRDKRKWTKIMLLTDAPGADDEKAGELFVGRTGQLLRSLCEQAGVPFDQCAITSVFHCRPPEDEVMRFFTGERAEADEMLRGHLYKGAMLRKQYGNEIARLLEELVIWRPKCIVTLGAVALWALTGRSSVQENFGKPIPIQSHVILPVYHPLYLLQANNPQRIVEAVDALRAALDFAVVN